MALRELDGQGRYIIRTHHKRTVGGQKIEGKLLKCEPWGASDYCMHCSRDMCTGAASMFCKSLNNLAYGEDPAEIEARQKRFEAAIAVGLAPSIVAFGCDSEVKGGKLCARWCGSDNCAMSLKNDSEDAPIPAGEVEYLSWRPHGAGWRAPLRKADRVNETPPLETVALACGATVIDSQSITFSAEAWLKFREAVRKNAS